jgi:hypothetical protein
MLNNLKNTNMKKLYFLLIILISTASFGQTPIITAIVDGDCSGGNPKVLEIYAKGTVDFTLYSLENQTNSNTSWGSTQDLSTLGTVTDGFVYISTSGSSTALGTDFPSISSVLESNTTNFNGDDRVRIILTSDSSVIDQYGVEATDGTGSTWEYADSYAKRKDGTGPDAGFNEANWTFGGVRALNNLGVCQMGSDTFETLIGGVGTYAVTASTNPTLLISDGPANGSSVVDSPELVDNATIDFTTTNFIMSNDSGSCVSDSSGEGYIKWDMEDTGTNTIVDSGCIFTSNGPPEYPVTGLSVGNTFLLTARLVDNNGDAFIPDVTYTLTVTIASYTDVADLATLRASTVSDEIFYRVTGEVINTYSRGTRNQKYFQDATGGILVDDEDFQVGSVYAEGDGVENIRGHLSTVSGVLQFIPTEADWGSATSTANDITPEVVTVSTLLSSWGSYESELVRINGVTFTDAGGSFSSSTSYDISDSSTMTFRTNFSEANYIGGVIPSGSNDIIVLVGEYFGTPQVTAKSMNDLTLSIGRTEIEGFAIYPNPVSNGEFSIRTNGGVSKSVQIFDMLGKQVYSKQVQANENVRISNLNTGIYILKVQEEGRLATRKLVVQ